MSFYQRIALACVSLALLTGLLAWGGFQQGDVRLIARTPEGQETPASATIRLSFSRPVDRRSVEESFRITPAVGGRFFWDETTLVFRPDRQLASATDYQVTIGTGLRDARGRANQAELAWRFRTRSPQLLALREGPVGGELWLVQPDGSGAQQLISESEPISAFALAPDGGRAVYVVARGTQRSALMLLNLADGTTRPLVDDPTISASAPSWTSTDDLILFERRVLINDTLSAPRVWLTQPDATQLGPLIGDAATITYAPVWSPDGYKVAMIDGATQAIVIYDFFSDQRRMLPDSSSEPVSWLPDGSGLIYSSVAVGADGPALRLRRSSLDGATSADLTAGGAAELGPAVAPDGGLVAYSRRELGSASSTIWVVPSAGGAIRQLSLPGPYRDVQPTWSPDGQQIAFVRYDGASPRDRSAWVVGLNGSPPTQALADVTQVGWVP